MSRERTPFRVLLINTSSTNEFNNTAANFKNRLPRPIRLEGDWLVALDDLSLPSNTQFASKINPRNRQFLFQTRILRRARNPGSGDVDVPYHISFDRNDLSKVSPTVNGVGFMKSVFESLDKWRYEGVLDTNPRFSRTVNNEEHRLYWKWQWEGDELVSDNALTYKGDATGRPYFLIDIGLAERMGWLEFNYGTSRYDLGPNLKQELFDPNIVPEINGSPPGDVHESDPSHHHSGRYVFWTTHDFNWGESGMNSDRGYLRLSYHCNWRFININAAFQGVIGSRKRTLLCYSDVCSPSTVGSQSVDLMREVTYEEGSGGSVYFEPHRLQHLGVRSNTLDVIGIQIAEKDGEFVDFHSGVTTVTLHFLPA